MIMNIHGLGSSGENSKYRWLAKNASGHDIWSPTIAYEKTSPEDILDFFSERLPEAKSGVYVVGSSMGGFFARIINQLFPDVTAVLINPALAPFLGLRGTVDCRAYLRLAAKHAYSDDENWRNLHVLIGDSDELIDHEKITLNMLPPNFDAIYRIRGGTHQMSVFSDEIGAILKNILGI
jgi:predicted esterase YcpF (UPF0227 family)